MPIVYVRNNQFKLSSLPFSSTVSHSFYPIHTALIVIFGIHTEVIDSICLSKFVEIVYFFTQYPQKKKLLLRFPVL